MSYRAVIFTSRPDDKPQHRGKGTEDTFLCGSCWCRSDAKWFGQRRWRMFPPRACQPQISCQRGAPEFYGQNSLFYSLIYQIFIGWCISCDYDAWKVGLRVTPLLSHSEFKHYLLPLHPHLNTLLLRCSCGKGNSRKSGPDSADILWRSRLKAAWSTGWKMVTHISTAIEQVGGFYLICFQS